MTFTLHCIALHCIALHCIALHCIALRCTDLHCIALHCIALHCIALHCIALHCITLHCISLNVCFLCCFSGGSIVPYSKGNITFNLLSPEPVPRPGHNDFYSTPELFEFVKASAIRVRLRDHYYVTQFRHKYFGIFEYIVTGRYEYYLLCTFNMSNIIIFYFVLINYIFYHFNWNNTIVASNLLH